jgi:type I restriction enzyme M protein
MAELSGVEINVSQVYNSIMALEILSDDYLRKIRIDYGNVVTDKIKNHYNKGYAFAPFAMRLSGGAVNFKTIFKDIELTARNSSELIFIDKLIKNLEGEDRRAVALVHGRVLFNNSDREYRNEIVKSGLLEGIIELPGNLHNNTAIKSFLLIFSDNNKSVKFLDATDLTLKNINNPRNTYLDIESIVSIYHSNVVPQKAANELLEIQNWIPSNILLDVYKPENGVTLSEVAEVFSGSQYTQKRFAEMFTESESNYRILTSSDIEDGLINYENLKPFVPEDDRYDKFAVTVNDLIITSKSSVVKMAVVDDIEDEKIIVTGGMIIVRPKTEKLNSTFLKIFLESEQGQNIIKSIQKGITIVTLNAKDLANIIIPLPSINYQNKVAGKYNSKLAMLLAYKKEISNIENDLKNFYYEEVEVGNK